VLKVEEKEAGSQRCPFCHSDVEQGTRWECPGCGTVHHEECAREAKRCTVLGCRTDFQTAARAAPLVEPSRTNLATRVVRGGIVLTLLSVALVAPVVLIGFHNNRDMDRSLTESWDKQSAQHSVVDAVLRNDLAEARAARKRFEAAYQTPRGLLRDQVKTYVWSSASVKLHFKTAGELDAFLDQVFAN
jgi:hypothetical protein